MWGEFTSGVFRESLLFGWKKAQHEPLHYLFMFLAMPLLSQFKYRPASNKKKKKIMHKYTIYAHIHSWNLSLLTHD